MLEGKLRDYAVHSMLEWNEVGYGKRLFSGVINYFHYIQSLGISGLVRTTSCYLLWKCQITKSSSTSSTHSQG